MILGSRVKDPADHKTLSVDWSTYLSSIDDTLDTVEWTVPTGLTNDDESNTTTVANIRVSGGTDGTTYQLANVLTSAGGEVKRVVIEVVVEA